MIHHDFPILLKETQYLKNNKIGAPRLKFWKKIRKRSKVAH